MENPKKKDSLPEAILQELGDSLVTAAEQIHQATHTISRHAEPEEEMSSRTSSPCAEVATLGFTPAEYEASLDKMENELTEQEEAGDCLIFQTIFSGLEKDEDGGYTISFQIAESDSLELARLIAKGRLSHTMVLTPFTP